MITHVKLEYSVYAWALKTGFDSLKYIRIHTWWFLMANKAFKSTIQNDREQQFSEMELMLNSRNVLKIIVIICMNKLNGSYIIRWSAIDENVRRWIKVSSIYGTRSCSADNWQLTT